MSKKEKPRVLIFTILTTITLLTWVLFEVWHSFTKPVPAQVEEKVLQNLDPTIDINLIKDLRQKLYIDDREARRGSITKPAETETGTGAAQTP